MNRLMAILPAFIGLVLAAEPGRAAEKVASVEPTPTVLKVRLTTANELSAVSQRALINETESIWRDARVQLRWIRDNRLDEDRPLRIVVARREIT